MKRYIIKYTKKIFPVAVLLLTMGMGSCVGDLDITPIDPNKNTKLDPTALLNMCYTNLGLEGIEGSGKANIAADDRGTVGLVRQMFNVNELTTGEAICAWFDPGVTTLNTNKQDANNMMLSIYYNRLYYGISICNQCLGVASGMNVTQAAEVRFLRAPQFYLAMDVFGNIPLPTATAPEKPTQKTQAEVYQWLEKELLEIEPNLSDARPKTSKDVGYGCIDKVAAWMFLSRLYLNAQIYTGTPRWTKAAEYAKKVTDSPYQLNKTAKGGYSAYQLMFMGDNGENGSSVEAIFPILQQGNKTVAYGCMTFMMASSYTNDMSSNGTTGTWSGNRARKELASKFFPSGNAPQAEPAVMIKQAGDDWAISWRKNRTLKIESVKDIADFKKGYSVMKLTNVKSDGVATANTGFTDTDFFFSRTAEAYLTYAEATARLNNNIVIAEEVALLNELRQRSYASTKAGYSINDILDERSREFYFKGQRRVGLICYGEFGGNSDYVWSRKGGAASGRNFNTQRNVFPLPYSDPSVSENLKQDTGH